MGDLARPSSDFCLFLQKLLPKAQKFSQGKNVNATYCHETLCEVFRFCGKLLPSARLPHSLPRRSGRGNAPLVPHSHTTLQEGCGVPHTSPLPAPCPFPMRDRLLQALWGAPAPYAKDFPGGMQFSGSSAGCTVSSALEAEALEAETHLRAVQEQQVPAFLAKEEKKKKVSK